jgi:predicted nucleic acid-binding protein
MTLVLDASAAAKLVVEEWGSREMRALVDAEANRIGGGMMAPELILAEVGNVLWRYVSRGELPGSDAAEGLRWLPSIFRRLEPLASLAGPALHLSMTRDHPIYDCFYVELATREAAPLVTADRRLANRFRDLPAGIILLGADHPGAPSSA